MPSTLLVLRREEFERIVHPPLEQRDDFSQDTPWNRGAIISLLIREIGRAFSFAPYVLPISSRAFPGAEFSGGDVRLPAIAAELSEFPRRPECHVPHRRSPRGEGIYCHG